MFDEFAEFTDRHDAISKFNEYMKDDPPPSNVLVFHGDGYVGKTKLLGFLRQSCSNRSDLAMREGQRRARDEVSVKTRRRLKSISKPSRILTRHWNTTPATRAPSAAGKELTQIYSG